MKAILSERKRVLVRLAIVPVVWRRRWTRCSDGCGTVYPQKATPLLRNTRQHFDSEATIAGPSRRVYTCGKAHTYHLIKMYRKEFPSVWSSFWITAVSDVLSSFSLIICTLANDVSSVDIASHRDVHLCHLCAVVRENNKKCA